MRQRRKQRLVEQLIAQPPIEALDFGNRRRAGVCEGLTAHVRCALHSKVY
jgi:hypothetical protein